MEFVPIVKCVLISDLEPYLIAKIFNLNLDIVERGLAGRLEGQCLHYSRIILFLLCAIMNAGAHGACGAGDMMETNKRFRSYGAVCR